MALLDFFNRKNNGISAKDVNSQLSSDDKKKIFRVIQRQESIVRRDIRDWKEARYEATLTDEPRQHLLQVLYNEIMLDAKMTSQIELRIGKSQASQFSLQNGKEETDEEATKKLKDSGLFDRIVKAIVESFFYSQSVCEFSFDANGNPHVDVVPRTNIAPDSGRFYPDIYGSESELYRERPDYGKHIIEFHPENFDLGKLNKAVPYVLMKKFALSCWSELCEIFGIPPRVLKTNTTDTDMLTRAEQMMKEIGSAAYFIIDTEEDFEFAQAASTNGDVYRNFIAVCDEQISLLNLGAVLGQDTLNGNRSKEESSSQLMYDIVESDKRKIEYYFNKTVIPALESIGVLPAGLRFEYAKAVDTKKLWEMVYQASSFYDFDIEWLKQTFGMEITGARMNQTPDEQMKFNFFG